MDNRWHMAEFDWLSPERVEALEKEQGLRPYLMAQSYISYRDSLLLDLFSFRAAVVVSPKVAGNPFFYLGFVVEYLRVRALLARN